MGLAKVKVLRIINAEYIDVDVNIAMVAKVYHVAHRRFRSFKLRLYVVL